MESVNVRRQLGADLALLLVTAIWGGTFVMVKDAVEQYPVFPFLTLRFALASAVLLVIGGRRIRTLGWKGWGAGALIGLFLFAGYSLQTLGLQQGASASKAGFITGLSVVIVPVLSAGILRRRPAREAVLGVILATVGLGALTLDGNLSVTSAELLILGCALAFAAHIVAVSFFAANYDALALTTAQVLTVAVASAAASLFVARPWPVLTSSVAFAAAFNGVLATALAFFVQTAMQRFTTPTHTALIFTGEPVFAALFGVWLDGDLLTAQILAGGVLIVGGTVISEVRWSERTARWISRFMAPQYIIGLLLPILGLADPVSWRRGVAWAVGIGVVVIGGTLGVLTREMRHGRISDWHISVREERLQLMTVVVPLLAAGLPVAALAAFDGPRLLLIAFVAAAAVIVVNLLITVRWKISQHVAGVAVGASLVTGVMGVGAAPTLLLIPLVAWARVKVGAHTVMQTIAGGACGIAVTVLIMRLFGAA